MESYRKLIFGVYAFIAALCFQLQFCLALDTLIPGKSIRTTETLISKGENFVLGFFNTSIPYNLYLGIWYYKIPVQTVVWVANRESPLTDSSGSLQIGNDGNLVILNGEGTSIWTTNVPFFAKNPIAKLLDSGNLIIIEAQDDDDDGNNANFLWQGFDYPSDTLLPGMKLGLDHKTGRNRFLTSWRSKDDPSWGSFSLGFDHRGLPQLFLYGNATPIFRSGPWVGDQSSVTPDFIPGFDSKLYFQAMVRLYFQSMVNFSFISNQDEVYYTYSMTRTSIVSRSVLLEPGIFQRFTWNDESKAWFPLWKTPTDDCASYEYCPSFASCNSNSQPLCSCLEGFEPRSVDEWSLNDFSGGCKRKMELRCNGDGFLQMSNIKFPDTSQVQVEGGLRVSDCEAKCLKSCNCTAYANANINGRVQCLIWSGDLNDLRDISNSDHHFYMRVAAPESGKKKKVHVTIIIVIIVGSIIFGLCSYFLWSKFKYKESPKKEENCDLFLLNLSHRVNASPNILNSKKLWGIMNRRNGPKIPVFDMVEISNATDNFSSNNKLGEGGFGVVYKGTLSNGQEIAVKRLSKVSRQGLEEFKNEVVLTTKLQHRNLVQLFGCCIKEQEKMLVYEYMPNKSLDTILFDPNKRSLLDWDKRFHIIQGIARGLLYLHRDSTLRIIHRDLKASNILLDGEMNPKISDFGTARIFEGNQTQANTNKVIGTYGYMSPEYAMRGLFSVKSDVFSFGVVLLEIISGRRNTSFYQCEHSLTLIGYAWRMWNENKRLELMDPILGDSCPLHEVMNCIHVGLLCVQADAEDRPTMDFVVSMIENEIVAPPLPKEPAFSIGGRVTCSSDNNNVVCCINDVTITMVEGR